MNRVQLTGRLVREPDIREINGRPLCLLRLAIEGMRDGGETGYVDVAVWGRAGHQSAQLGTGWLVAVEGRLRYRQWRASDGGVRSGLSVVGDVEPLVPPRRRSIRQPIGRAA